MLSKILMDERFRKWVAAWIIVCNPWILLWEQKAVRDPLFDLFLEEE